MAKTNMIFGIEVFVWVNEFSFYYCLFKQISKQLSHSFRLHKTAIFVWLCSWPSQSMNGYGELAKLITSLAIK